MKTAHQKSNPDQAMRTRFALVALFFGLCFLAIGAKAVYLQVYQGSWLSRKAADQYEKTLKNQGKRGIIYDRERRELAVSIEAVSIAAYPRKIADAKTVARKLARTLKLKRRDVARKLASNRPFVWIKRQATPKEHQAVRELALDGVAFRNEHTRYYPHKSMAAQLIGFTGIDGRGLEGLEFAFNDQLKGMAEDFTVLKDALGRGFDAEKKVSPLTQSGNNLVLTIDQAIQHITESALQEAVQTHSARSGMAVVMDPRTGELLALAHFPHFNPNTFKMFGRADWRNRAVTDPFEPGSTMKIFSAAAALESGQCTPSTIFYCENGAYRIGRNTVHDTKKYGWLSLQQIVKYSSNIGAVKMGEIIGPQALHQTLQAFGFGRKTGIACPGESPGSLLPSRRWSKIDAGAIAFGQGIAVSAIQLAAATSAIANDGVLMQPQVVKAVLSPAGEQLQHFAPRRIRRVVSAQTARTVGRILETVITPGGTGVKAAMQGYTVCGKTGTAQKTDPDGTYSKSRYVASFVGFAPARNPAITVLVIVDEPEKEHYGGIVAAPAFRKIVYDTLNHLNILPGKTDDRQMQLARQDKAHG